MIIDCLSKAIFLYFIYNVIALMLFGVPKSLSMTYYLFKNRVENLKFLFPSMMILLTVFLLPCWLQMSVGSPYQFTAFLSAVGILFVGFTPAFNNSKMEGTIHTVSACISAAAALAWILLVTPYWYVILGIFAIVSVIAILTKTWKTCSMYWLETVAFVSTFVAMLDYYLEFIKLV